MTDGRQAEYITRLSANLTSDKYDNIKNTRKYPCIFFNRSFCL